MLTTRNGRSERFNSQFIVDISTMEATVSEPTLILQNMRGGCATDGKTVHALFRFNGRPLRQESNIKTDAISARDVAEALEVIALGAKA